MSLPITAISRVLQTTMHAQQFVTTLALKGDSVFERLTGADAEQPEWATFDEDVEPEYSGAVAEPGRHSRFDRYPVDAEPDIEPGSDTASAADTNGDTAVDTPGAAADPAATRPTTNGSAPAVPVPEVATRYDYAEMTLAQLRARLRLLDLGELTALLDYEQRTRDRAPFVTMLTNRIATVTAQ